MHADFNSCYEKALSLLARAEHSRRLLTGKLTKKGFEPEIIAEVADRLEEENALNDLRYAELWISCRMKKRGEGAGLLLAGLLKRGIDRDTAEEAVKNCRDEDACKDALRKAYEKVLRKGPCSRLELTSLLRRKGFSVTEINTFLEEIH